MKLLLVRHAIAEDAEPSAAGDADALRPLSEIGRKKMRKGANRLRSQVRQIDVLACSPEFAPAKLPKSLPALLGICRCWSVPNWISPIRPKRWWSGWRKYPAETVVAVGHEPHLGLLSGLLLVADALSR